MYKIAPVARSFLNFIFQNIFLNLKGAQKQMLDNPKFVWAEFSTWSWPVFML